MSATIPTLFFLWASCLFPGGGGVSPTAIGAAPAAHRVAPDAILPSWPPPTISPGPAGEDRPWTLSEADDAEEDPDRDDDGLADAILPWASRAFALGATSPLGRDGGLVRAPARSPILRC